MKIVINDKDKINKILTIFKNIKLFTDCLAIYLDETKGLYIQGIDRTQCCMCEIKIIPLWFDEFVYNTNNDIETIGVNTIILNKVMNTYTEGQTITLSISDTVDDKINIVFEGNDKILDKHFQIPLINIEQDILAIPDQNRQVDLTMETKQFVDLINQMQIFHDALFVIFTEETVEMSAQGSDCEMKVNISLDDVIEYGIEENLTLNQSYAIQFIQLMCAFNKLSSELAMKFDTNLPMEGKYSLGDDSFMSFFIAPKIDDE